jgi:hypothetical protein
MNTVRLGGTSQSILNTQHFFDTQSRDVVDESDENFNVKFKLVHAIGSQRRIKLWPRKMERYPLNS